MSEIFTNQILIDQDENEHRYDVVDGISSPINAISLGADPTGKKDVSSIINKYTDKFSLYFPAGIYKVSNPVYLKNSLIGALPPEPSHLSDMPLGDYTIFESAINSDDDTEGVINVTGESVRSITIQNLFIETYTKECGVRMETTNFTRLILNHICVFVSENGITGYNLNGFSSAGLYGYHLSAYHKYDATGTSYVAGSAALHIGTNTYDSYFDDLTLFGFHDCIIADGKAGGTCINNVHGWCGDYGTSHRDVQTRFIVNNTKSFLNCNYLYSDQMRVVFTTDQQDAVGLSKVNVDRLLVYGCARLTTNCAADIVKGEFYPSDMPDTGIVYNDMVNFGTQPVFHLNSQLSATNNNYYVPLYKCGQNFYTFRLSNTGSTKWIRVLDAFYTDYLDCYIRAAGQLSHIVVNRGAGSFKKTNIIGSLGLKYKIDAGSNRLHIFTNTAITQIDVYVVAAAAFVTNPGCYFKGASSYLYNFEVTEAAANLTDFT